MPIFISYPLPTKLTVENAVDGPSEIHLEAGEPLQIEHAQATLCKNEEGEDYYTSDFYLGNFNCVFGAPSNYTVQQ